MALYRIGNAFVVTQEFHGGMTVGGLRISCEEPLGERIMIYSLAGNILRIGNGKDPQ